MRSMREGFADGYFTPVFSPPPRARGGSIGWKEKETCMEFFRMDGNRAAKLPFSDAVRVGEVLYLSGQMGIAPGTMKIVEGGIDAETRQMFENIERMLKHCGRDLGDVFKCTVMLADM